MRCGKIPQNFVCMLATLKCNTQYEEHITIRTLLLIILRVYALCAIKTYRKYNNFTKKEKINTQAHYRPADFQEVEAARFQDNQYMKVVMLPTLSIGRHYPKKIYLICISVRN
jgi:hypothetical protein